MPEYIGIAAFKVRSSRWLFNGFQYNYSIIWYYIFCLVTLDDLVYDSWVYEIKMLIRKASLLFVKGYNILKLSIYDKKILKIILVEFTEEYIFVLLYILVP